MRNLKRVLSLALACVMVIGMMVMTTGAADFDDAAEIEYTEAVDVMSALGVLEGHDGIFNPNGNLTRDQGAKIIAYMMLGADKADQLVGTGMFADVPADMWSAGYVEYCANLGIVSGWNGNFAPGDELLTVQFGKMLLCALGYDADIEGYGGDNWATNIAIDMVNVGISIDGLSMIAPLTREQAAQMMLNTLKAPTVTYAIKGTSITVGGTTINTGSSTPTEGALFMTKYEELDAEGTPVDDKYGRPAKLAWELDGETIYNELYTPVATYVNSFTKDIADAMTEANKGDDAFANADIYYNGKKMDVTLYPPVGAVNGYTIELYSTDTNPKTIERVVVIESNFAVVTDVTETEGTTPGSVTLAISWYGLDGNSPEAKAITYTDDLTKTNDQYDALVGYAEDTALIVTLHQNWRNGADLLNVEVPTAVAGTITKLSVGTYTTTTTVDVDGTTYGMNNLFVGGKALTVGEEGTLYLDAQGKALGWIADDPADPEIKYAYVLEVDSEEGGLFDNNTVWYAKLLYTDGTTEIVPIPAADKDLEGLVTYAPGTGANAGKIDLDNATAAMDGVTTIGKNQVELNSKVANGKTVYVVETDHATIPNKKVYTVYTGVTNVPALENAEIYGATNVAGTTWTVVYAMSAELVVGDTSTTAKDIAYLVANNNKITEYVDKDTNIEYYVYNAVVGGKVTTVKVDASEGANEIATGLYAGLVSEDGLVINKVDMQYGEQSNGAVTAQVNKEGTAVAKDGVIALGGTNYLYDDATVVYKVANGAISASSIGAIKADTTDTVVGYTTNGILTMIVVTAVSGS